MTLNEAKQTVKDLVEAIHVLLEAAEGIKSTDFEALKKRKDALDQAVIESQKRAQDASAEADAKVAKAKAESADKLADLQKQLKDAEAQVGAVRTEAKVSRETLSQQIAQEKADLTTAKQLTVERLDKQIATKQKALDEINRAIEEGKRRFA
jgi:hypothetical protein